jgi:predicted transcriptional regulator
MAPLPKSLAEAPEDDEPLTTEEIAMLDARLAEAASGRTIPHDEVVRRLRLAYRD